jgi:hypothetical protein
MYIDPGVDYAPWTQLDNSANSKNIDAIINPDSGPGPSVDPSYVKAIGDVNATRYGKAFAYVYTNFGSRDISLVEADIQKYLSLYGANNFAGFFIDQMNIPANLSYYQSLYNYIKQDVGSSYTVIGNPGNPFIFPLTPDQVLSTADQLVIFEGPNTAPPGDPGFNNYPYPDTGLTEWWQNYPSSRFANIIYDTPEGSLQSDFNKAQGLNAGSIYVTMDSSYGSLPSYWDQEVAMLPTPTPEPSSLIVATACGLVACAVGSLRGRSRTQRNGG